MLYSLHIFIIFLQGTEDRPQPPAGKKRRLLVNDDLKVKSPRIDEATGLHQDQDGFVHVYTDGSCEGNGTANTKAGYGIWWADNHSLNRGEAASKATNNAAEIEAITEAIKLATSFTIQKLKIHTDSKFAIQCITEWMPKWKKNNWMTAERKPVKNRIELEALDKAMKAAPGNAFRPFTRPSIFARVCKSGN